MLLWVKFRMLVKKKLGDKNIGYDEDDVIAALQCMERVDYKEKGKVSEFSFQFFDAGHIPGSSCIYLSDGNKSILYTGDFNSSETRLVPPSAIKYPPVDNLIIETTYGDRDHPPRQLTENKFLDKIEAVIGKGGSCIIPVFAVGRAQEILLVLATRNFKVPIYLDGMARKVTDLYLENPNSIKDPDALKKAFKNVKTIKSWRQRKEVVRKQGIFVTTSGMLTGGPVLDYLKALHNDPQHAILLTGYQGELTNGRMLLDSGHVIIDGWKSRVRCHFEKFDFSAHSDAIQLKQFVKHVKPKRIFLVHGDEEAMNTFAEWSRALGFETHIPKSGEIISI